MNTSKLSAAPPARHEQEIAATKWHEWRWTLAACLAILFIADALNIWGDLTTPSAYHFGGLVYNWQDGNSYLAKLQEGMRGEWLYTVPFTVERGNATFLYPHYLLLGHVSRWLGVEPVVVFNYARLMAGLVLLVALYDFMSWFFTQMDERRAAFLLAAVGSGLGWALVPFGMLMPDFWQAEIFPFLSIMSNPHFALALAATLWLLSLLVLRKGELHLRQWLALISCALILAFLQPYALVNVGAIAGLLFITRWRSESRLPSDLLKKLGVVVLVSAPYVLYAQWVIVADPVLAGWDRQNQTNSPPIWNYFVAFGFVLPLALWGLRLALSRRGSGQLLLVFWIVTSACLIYLPGYHQQRRFAFGLFVPLAILAVQGLAGLPRLNRPIARASLVALSSLSNLTLLIIAFAAMAQFAPYLYFVQAEWNGLMFLRQQAEAQAIVLASPDFGLYIPAWAGQRVIYGHPHETSDARAHAEAVLSFYAGTMTNTEAFLRPVDYIFVGPREHALGNIAIPTNYMPVFEDGEVTIFRRQGNLSQHIGGN